MTKRLSKKSIVLIVVGGIVVLFATVLILFFVMPRQLTSVAGVGKLEKVTAITYKTSPCCGYMEGAEFETTITDSAAIERVTNQFNSAQLKWTFPQLRAGGSNCEVTFHTASGKKIVKFNQGKIGNYQFTSLQNALSALFLEDARPEIYLNHRQYNVDIAANYRIINSYSEYQEFVATITDFERPGDNISGGLFEDKKIVMVNLGSGSSSRLFYLIKITQTETGVYTLKLVDMQNSDASSNDNVAPMAAALFVPKDFDVTKLTYDIVPKSSKKQ